MKWITVLIAILLPLETSAAAQWPAPTAGALSRVCTKEGSENTVLLDRAACHGYLQGIADLLAKFDVSTSEKDEAGRICLPDDIRGADLAAVLKVYLLRNPKQRQKHPELVTVIALRDAFPCEPSG